MKLFKTTDDDLATEDETPYDENGDTAMSVDTTQTDGDEQPVTTGLAYDRDSADETATEDDPAPAGSIRYGARHADPAPVTDTDTAPVTDTEPVSYDEPVSYAEPADTAPVTDTAPVADTAQPTFTPSAGPTGYGAPATGSVPVITDAPVTSARPDPAVEDESVSRPVPAAAAARAGQPVTSLPADEARAAVPADEPLLANPAGIQASWQTVQAGFVDDPRAAVSDAADLIVQTAQSVIDAVQQRQRQLSVLSDRGAANGTADGADPTAPGYPASGNVPDTEQLRLMMQHYRSLFNQLCSA